MTLQNEEIATEGELRSHSVDDSDKVRDLQDKVADLQAEVNFTLFSKKPITEYVHWLLLNV